MSLRCLLLLSALAALLALIACGGSASPTAGPGESTRETAEVAIETPEVSRRDVLTSLTGRVIVPRYRQASDAMGGLAISVGCPVRGPRRGLPRNSPYGVAGCPRRLGGNRGIPFRAGHGPAFGVAGRLVAGVRRTHRRSCVRRRTGHD